jgi:hypothetical protein
MGHGSVDEGGLWTCLLKKIGEVMVVAFEARERSPKVWLELGASKLNAWYSSTVARVSAMSTAYRIGTMAVPYSGDDVR